MNAYTVAGEILGAIELGPGQVARLRAVDHEYQQRLYALLHPPGSGGRGTEREPTPAERAELRAFLVSGVRALLTPGRRAGAGHR